MRMEYIVVAIIIMLVVILALSLFSSNIVPGFKDGLTAILKSIGVKV